MKEKLYHKLQKMMLLTLQRGHLDAYSHISWIISQEITILVAEINQTTVNQYHKKTV